MKECAEFSLRDATFGRWVFPGCGAVYFERTAMEDLFKVDLGREARRPNHSFSPVYSDQTSSHDFCLSTLFTHEHLQDALCLLFSW